MYIVYLHHTHNNYSTIFRTITDESTGATKSIGLLGLSLKDISNVLQNIKSHGLINALFNNSIIDETTIDKYNQKILAGIPAQEALASASKGTNKATIALMESANGATVSTEALTAAQKQSTLAAKAVALKALSIVGNMIAMWAIGKVITFIATKIDNLANASKHASESANELASKMNNFIGSMSSNASKLSELNDEYQELSKGVNQLGENIGLSTDDYSRYKDIISQVSTIMPTLTTYFNAQGEKIAFAKGELKDLNKEYEKYIQNEAIKFVTKGDSDGNKIQDILNNYNKNESFTGFEKFWKGTKNAFGSLSEDDFTSKEIINALEQLTDAKSVKDIFDKLQKKLMYTINPVGGKAHLDLSYHDTALNYMLMKELGLAGKTERELLSMTEADYNALMEKINGYVNDYNTQIASDMNSVRTALLQEAYSKDSYWALGKDIRNDVTTFLSSINSDIWDELNISTDHEFSVFVNKIINSMADNTDGFDETWKNLFSPELKELPIDEYSQKINESLIKICDTLGLDEEKGVLLLKIALGFEDIDNTANKLQNSIKNILGIHQFSDHFSKGISGAIDYAKIYQYTKDFTQSQAELWLEATRGAKNAEQAIEMYENALREANDDNKSSLSISKTVDQLNTRLKPAMDSLKSAWQNIFTDDEADLNSIDILSTCDSIKSKLDELNNINGVTVDYSSYEYFVRVLRDSESTTNDVKDAFNSLATSITQAALSGAEDFETMKAALEDLGVVNSEMVAFDALISNTEALKDAGIDLASVTNERLLEFANESVAAENAAQAYDMLRFHKELCNMQEMNTSNEVANLRTLAENAGYTGSIIQYLTELEQIYQELAGTTNPIVIGVKLARAAQLQALIQNAAVKINYTPEVDFSHIEKATKKAEINFTDLLDKELAVLDKKMEAGYVDFNDYIQARLALIEDYYSQGKIKADEYYSYLEKHYKQELSYRDKVIKAVTRRIDKEIKSLEKEKDAIKENYQLQIDALENQKTLLEDVNKERQRQIDLQKALYELERARNQRTKLIYSEDKGMHYVADDTAIRDAENEAENARHEIQISEIEKSITLLEKSRDAETDAIDDMIDKLQEYKEAWSDITSAYEESQEDLLAAQFFGQEWEEDIINCRTDVLNKFKDDYADIQQSIIDKAWESANEQIRAAKEAAKGADGVMGGADKTGDDPHGDDSQWEVVDESNPIGFPITFPSKKAAEDYARELNKNTAASNGIDVSEDDGDNPKWMREFGNSNIPGYYVKKYHTGLKQGLVDKHSFDDDFKLVQKVGLGEKEVPAILKEGEAVATPAQISNIADRLRTADGIHSVQAERPYFMDEQERLEQCAALLGRSIDDMLYPSGMILHGMASHDMEKMTGMGKLGSPVINAINNTKNVQPVVNQNITLNCPNVTNSSGVEYLQKELGHLSLKAMQETIRRY